MSWHKSFVIPAKYSPSPLTLFRNVTTTRVPFVFDSIYEDAVKTADLGKDTAEIPELSAWRRLVDAMADKPFVSPLGSQFLRMKVVHFMAQRMMIEKKFKEYAADMENVASNANTVFVIGIPRSGGGMLSHVLGTTGALLGLSSSDVCSPAEERYTDRRQDTRPLLDMLHRAYPDFVCNRILRPNWADDDLHLQMLKPNSIAWGLLHGLDDHLRMAIEEPNYMGEVYEFEAQVLKLLRVYRDMGQLPELVERELHNVGSPINIIRWGTNDPIENIPFVVQSPLGVCFLPDLTKAFPQARLVWCHRALAQGIPSTCASLLTHDIMYTHKTPMDSTLVRTGHKILGLYGSGTDRAIEFLEGYPSDRVMNLSNRDINRGCMRVVGKLLPRLGIEIDRWRQQQGINGFSAMMNASRPRHMHHLDHFGVSEAQLGEVFKTYVNQFEEYAFEPFHGITRFIPPEDITLTISEAPKMRNNLQTRMLWFDQSGHHGDGRE